MVYNCSNKLFIQDEPCFSQKGNETAKYVLLNRASDLNYFTLVLKFK